MEQNVVPTPLSYLSQLVAMKLLGRRVAKMNSHLEGLNRPAVMCVCVCVCVCVCFHGFFPSRTDAMSNNSPVFFEG